MADGTHIEWTDATWNVINGCSVVSPGCTNCYAMRLAGTRLKHHASRSGLTIDTKAGPVWTGETRFNEAVLLDPLKWRRARRIFVCAHGDLFHESVPDEWIDRVFAVMALAPQHQFQVLTKRPQRMRDYFQSIDNGGDRLTGDFWRDALVEGTAQKIWHDRTGDDTVDQWLAVHLPLPNVWLGVSVEDQARADERIPLLLDTPAAVRWLSCEPLLGPLDLSEWLVCPNWSDDIPMDMTTGLRECCAKCDYTGIAGFSGLPIVDWVVAGGESGPGARPMHPKWARSLRDQCDAADVAFLFKQWGEWGQDNGPPASGRDRIFEGSARAAVFVEGGWRYLDNGFQGPIDWCKRADDWLFAIGKGKAGRALDGQLHDGYPA